MTLLAWTKCGLRLGALAVLAVTILAGTPGGVRDADAAAAKPAVRALRIDRPEGMTRLEIDFSTPVRPDLFTLADSYRLVMDLPEVYWDVVAGENLIGEGLIKALRFTRNRPGQSRLILDLSGPVSIIKSELKRDKPRKGENRYVLELVSTSRNDFMRTAGWPARHLLQAGFSEPSIPDPARGVDIAGAVSGGASRGAPRQKGTRTKPVIVIDAGHGGHDPGSIGVTGIHEKKITLGVAAALKKALKKSGKYTIHMTRDEDVFVDHADRVAFAREKKAALFISLHADSNPNKGVRGTSVYTLSERASDQAAGRHARRENSVNGLQREAVTNDVLKILIELAQRDTMINSVRFAKGLLPSLKERGLRSVSNSHRFGPFYVLTAADVPSVLIEMGFVSSAEDVKLMTSPKWRARLVAAIEKSVDRFFSQDEVAELETARRGKSVR